MTELKNYDIDVSEEMAEFNIVLSRESIELQGAVRAELFNKKEQGKQFVRDKIPYAKALLEKIRNQKNKNTQTLVHGNPGKFRNFLEAADFLEDNKKIFSNNEN